MNGPTVTCILRICVCDVDIRSPGATNNDMAQNRRILCPGPKVEDEIYPRSKGHIVVNGLKRPHKYWGADLPMTCYNPRYNPHGFFCNPSEIPTLLLLIPGTSFCNLAVIPASIITLYY